MREFNQAQIGYAAALLGNLTGPKAIDVLRYELGHERAEAEELLRKVLQQKGATQKMTQQNATAPAQAQPPATPCNVAQFRAYMQPGVRVRCIYRYYWKDEQKTQVLTVSRTQSNGIWFKPVPPETIRESWAEFPPAKRISFTATGYEVKDPTRGFVMARYEWMPSPDEERRQREAARADLAFEIRELEGLEASANDPTEARKLLAAAWAKMRELEAADHA